ncbi:MAG: metallophosphoesterase [Candidatus Aminicenantes bacterium]|nr:metallophosphoesterase [Candidatus Aminicenantes bacterium]
MTLCFFASDLHGHTDRFKKLFHAVAEEHPEALFLGGDILPSQFRMAAAQKCEYSDFIHDYLDMNLKGMQEILLDDYPRIFLILGNDDGRPAEAPILEAAARGVWEYVHNRKVTFKGYTVFGYSYVPPTPFLLKDWEKYDVSRYVDPGCVSPEEGMRTLSLPESSIKYATIKKDLEDLTGNENLEKAIFLFHSPPYQTKLDRAALDGKTIDHVPLDVHVGSIAIRRFIERRRPMLTLHGHIHESSKLTGEWCDRIENTYMFNGAYDGPELALVRFDLENLDKAKRELL